MHTIERERLEVRRPARRGRPPAIVSPQLLSATREVRPEELILHLHGQLDVTTALTFRDIVFTAMGERPLTLVLDLTDIAALDAAGISALVTVSRVSRLVRQDLGIRPSPHFAQLLAETGLDRLFTVAPDALAA